MRLADEQIAIIKQIASRVLGVPHRVWLFGSRVDDAQRGGDIDLLLETDAVLNNRAQTICKIYGAMIMALGERKIDLLLKDGQTPSAPVFEVAKRTGVLL
ncbi:MAG: nucleotidyltransferase domain-containing protein [Nitrosomonadales bacterium]|nr:nucleotidyltransferase domain-containing protein [Nitrosomonadales bacterium]